MTRARLFRVLGFVIAIAGVAFVVHAIDWSDRVDDSGQFQPGFLSVLSQADRETLSVSFVLLGVGFFIGAVRWWLLLRASGFHVPLKKVLKLHTVGAFFNYCVPIGSTGGDFVKAYYAAVGSSNREGAVVSILVDRVIGLVALVMLGGLAGLPMLGDPLVDIILLNAWGGLLLGGIATLAYASLAVRGVVARVLARFLHRLDLLVRLDAAVIAYRGHLPAIAGALALGLAAHAFVAVAIVMAGLSLGVSASPLFLFSVVPVLMLCAMLPLTPLGIGTTEALGIALLVDGGAVATNQLVSMLLFWRTFQLAYSLIGSIFVIRGGIRMHPDTQESTDRSG